MSDSRLFGLVVFYIANKNTVQRSFDSQYHNKNVNVMDTFYNDMNVDINRMDINDAHVRMMKK